MSIVSPCLTMGGMERASSTIANELAKREFEISFITILKKSIFFVLDEKINLIEPNLFNANKLDFWKTLFYIRKNVKLQDPDAVLVFGKVYASLVCTALIGTKYTVIVSERSSPYYKWPVLQRIIQKIAFTINPPKVVICQTQTAFEIQKKYYSRNTNFYTIPNAVRNVQFYPEVARENSIVAVGRLGEYIKGFDMLIEAYAKLNDTSWKLYLIGTTSGANHLISRVRELNLEDKILFLGPKKNIDPYLAKSKIFVIPSRSEGFPNALIEAMAAGNACVSFDFKCGAKDVIENGVNGLLIENGNINELAAGITKLQCDEVLLNNIARNALEIRAKLNVDTISMKYAKACFFN